MNEHNPVTPTLRLSELSVMDWWQLYCARIQVGSSVSQTSELGLRRAIEAFVIGASGQADWDKVPAIRLLEQRTTLRHWVTVGTTSHSRLTEKTLQRICRPLFYFRTSLALQVYLQDGLSRSNAPESAFQQVTRPSGDGSAQVLGLHAGFEKMEKFCQNLPALEAKALSLRPLKVSTHRNMEASLRPYISFLIDEKGVAAPTMEDLINRQWFESYLQDAAAWKQRSKVVWLLSTSLTLSRVARYLQATGRLGPEETVSFWNLSSLRALGMEAAWSSGTGLKA